MNVAQIPMKRLTAIAGGVVALILAGYGIADHMVNAAIKKGFDKQLASLEEQLTVTYERFHYNLITGHATARGITVTTPDGSQRVLMERLVVHHIQRDKAQNAVTALRLSGHGVRLREKRGEDYAPSLAGLGYSDPRLDFLIDHSFDPATRTLTVNEARLSSPELGSLDLKARLSGLQKVDTSDFSGGNILRIAGAIGGVQFHGATVDYRDKGLIERIMEHHESDKKVSRDHVVKEVAKTMRTQRFFRFSDEMIDQVSAFLRKPERLHIDSAPSQPVNRELIGMTLLFRGNLLQVFGVTIRNGDAG
jgi:hypothetical protein